MDWQETHDVDRILALFDVLERCTQLRPLAISVDILCGRYPEQLSHLKCAATLRVFRTKGNYCSSYSWNIFSGSLGLEFLIAPDHRLNGHHPTAMSLTHSGTSYGYEGHPVGPLGLFLLIEVVVHQVM